MPRKRPGPDVEEKVTTITPELKEDAGKVAEMPSSMQPEQRSPCWRQICLAHRDRVLPLTGLRAARRAAAALRRCASSGALASTGDGGADPFVSIEFRSRESGLTPRWTRPARSETLGNVRVSVYTR